MQRIVKIPLKNFLHICEEEGGGPRSMCKICTNLEGGDVGGCGALSKELPKKRPFSTCPPVSSDYRTWCQLGCYRITAYLVVPAWYGGKEGGGHCYLRGLPFGGGGKPPVNMFSSMAFTGNETVFSRGYKQKRNKERG